MDAPETLVLCLRDISTSPAKMIVELKVSTSDGYLDEDGEEMDFLPEEKISELFEKFTKEAKSKLPLPHSNFDVYLGYWVIQATFEIPKSFFDLISSTGWKVTFDLND